MLGDVQQQQQNQNQEEASSQPVMPKSIKWSSVLDEELERERVAFETHRMRQRLHQLRRQHALQALHRPSLQLQRLLHIQAPQPEPVHEPSPAQATAAAPARDALSSPSVERRKPATASASATPREASTRAHSRQSGSGSAGSGSARAVRALAGSPSRSRLTDSVLPPAPSPPAMVRQRKLAVGAGGASAAAPRRRSRAGVEAEAGAAVGGGAPGAGPFSTRAAGQSIDGAAPTYRMGAKNLMRRRLTRVSLSMNEPPSKEPTPVEADEDRQLHLPSRWVPKFLFMSDEVKTRLMNEERHERPKLGLLSQDATEILELSTAPTRPLRSATSTQGEGGSRGGSASANARPSSVLAGYMLPLPNAKLTHQERDAMMRQLRPLAAAAFLQATGGFGRGGAKRSDAELELASREADSRRGIIDRVLSEQERAALARVLRVRPKFAPVRRNAPQLPLERVPSLFTRDAFSDADGDTPETAVMELLQGADETTARASNGPRKQSSRPASHHRSTTELLLSRFHKASHVVIKREPSAFQLRQIFETTKLLSRRSRRTRSMCEEVPRADRRDMWIHPLKHITPVPKRPHHPSDRQREHRRGTIQPQAIDGGTNSSVNTLAMGSSVLDLDARPLSRVSISEHSTAAGPQVRPASVNRSHASTPSVLKKSAGPVEDQTTPRPPDNQSTVLEANHSDRRPSKLVRSQTDLSPSVRANASARGGRGAGASARRVVRSSPNAKRSLTARAAATATAPAPAHEWRRYAIEPTPLATSSSLFFKTRRVTGPLSERAATAPLRTEAARPNIRIPSADPNDSPKGQFSSRKGQFRPPVTQRGTAGDAGEPSGSVAQECKWPSVWEKFDIRFAGGLSDSLNRAAAEWHPAPAQLSEANVHRFFESQSRQTTEALKTMLLRSIPKRVAAETLAAKGKRFGVNVRQRTDEEELLEVHVSRARRAALAVKVNRNARLQQWLIDSNVLTAATALEYAADWESTCSTHSSADTVYCSRSPSSRASSPPAPPENTSQEEDADAEWALVVPSAHRPVPFVEPTFTVDIL